MLNYLVQLQGSTPVQNTQTMQLDAGQVIALVQPLLKPFEESLTILKEYKGQQEQSALRKQVQQAEMADSIRAEQQRLEDFVMTDEEKAQIAHLKKIVARLDGRYLKVKAFFANIGWAVTMIIGVTTVSALGGGTPILYGIYKACESMVKSMAKSQCKK